MDERIVNVLNYIEENLASPILLKDMAEVACMSSFHFHRLFKKETKTTAKRFVDLMKMEKALELVVNSDISITELSIFLGFNDYETFSRRFKKYHKISPFDLRNILKNINNKNDKNVIVISNDSYIENEIENKILNKIKKIDSNLLDDNVVTFLVFKNAKDNKLNNENTTNKEIPLKKFTIVETTKLWERIMNKYKTKEL